MTTAEKVRSLMAKSGQSQKAFAVSAGIHPITLCKCLKEDSFSMTSLKKIAKAQGVSISSLMPSNREKKMQPAPLINGYIEYDGTIEAIKSVEDLERVWNRVSGKTTPVCKQTTEPQEASSIHPKEKQSGKATPKYDIRCSDEGYAYFYQDVPLSNWWDSVPAIEYDGHYFNASESIFMYLKAKCFGDDATATKIVETDNKTTYKQPESRWRAVKKLGRAVEGFDDKVWARHNRDAMRTALKQKVKYDEEFQRVLFDPKYAGMTFCEASPRDTIWGCGLSKREAMEKGRAGWEGHNFLGRALTDLRNEMRPDLA